MIIEVTRHGACALIRGPKGEGVDCSMPMIAVLEGKMHGRSKRSFHADVIKYGGTIESWVLEIGDPLPDAPTTPITKTTALAATTTPARAL